LARTCESGAGQGSAQKSNCLFHAILNNSAWPDY
jgi:hypothetical protein